MIRESDKTYFGKLRKLSGMSQAFMLVFEYSGWYSDVNKTEQDSDKKSKEIEQKGVRRIAELWELSEAAERVLIKRWVEVKPKKATTIDLRKKPRGAFLRLLRDIERIDKSYEMDVELLLSGEGKIKEVQKTCDRLNEIDVKILPFGMIKEKHIYLDVTEINYKTFAKAYKAVRLCRDKLGINNKKDMKRGAPESIDFAKALVCAQAEERGLRRKELAEIMDFKIYREDNPSGSYPLLHKYLKVGRQMKERLDKLEEYMQAITGLKPEEG